MVRAASVALTLAVVAGCAHAKPLMAVNVPVVDLRAKPRTIAQPSIHDPLEETQLLYGERVEVKSVRDGWANIEAVEQPEFTHANRWQGYPGWLPAAALIPADPLAEPNTVVIARWAPTWQDAYRRTPSPWRFPLGTYVRAVDMGGELWRVELLDGTTVWMASPAAKSLKEIRARSPLEERHAILRSAALLIGEAYYWGGRSPHPASHDEPLAATGVDCSGLVNVAYRTVGVVIPRDAHEQSLRARPTASLQPADLIFLSERGNPRRIVHVLLYAGNGEVIEGPETGLAVRRISVVKRLGRPLDQIAPGTIIDGQTVSFGSYLP